MYQNYLQFSYLPHSPPSLSKPPFSHSNNLLIKNKSLPNILSSQFNSNINIINKQLSNIQTSPPTPSSTQVPFSFELHNEHIHYCISKYHFEIVSASDNNEKQALKEKNKFLLNQIKKLEKKLNESKLLNENKELKSAIKHYENELYAIKIQCEEILNENNELKKKMKYLKEELFNEITNKTKRKFFIINTTQFEIINNGESNYDTNNNNIETDNENENTQNVSKINTHTNKCNDSQDITFANSISNNIKHHNHIQHQYATIQEYHHFNDLLSNDNSRSHSNSHSYISNTSSNNDNLNINTQLYMSRNKNVVARHKKTNSSVVPRSNQNNINTLNRKSFTYITPPFNYPHIYSTITNSSSTTKPPSLPISKTTTKSFPVVHKNQIKTQSNSSISENISTDNNTNTIFSSPIPSFNPTFLFKLLYTTHQMLYINTTTLKYQTTPYIDTSFFNTSYIPETSLTLSSSNGLCIITGKSTNLFFFYDNTTHLISQLPSLNHSHYKGAIIPYPKNSFICISGSNTKKCEIYNTITSQWSSFPSMNHSHIDSSFVIINNTKIYALFGYDNMNRRFVCNIEMIDMNCIEKGWINVDVVNNMGGVNITGHKGFVEKGKVFIVGGFKGGKERLGGVVEVKFEKGEKERSVVVMKSGKNEGVMKDKGFVFDGGFMFFQDGNKKRAYSVDKEFNLHVINSDTMEYNVYNKPKIYE